MVIPTTDILTFMDYELLFIIHFLSKPGIFSCVMKLFSHKEVEKLKCEAVHVYYYVSRSMFDACLPSKIGFTLSYQLSSNPMMAF